MNDDESLVELIEIGRKAVDYILSIDSRCDSSERYKLLGELFTMGRAHIDKQLRGEGDNAQNNQLEPYEWPDPQDAEHRGQQPARSADCGDMPPVQPMHGHSTL